MYNNKSTELRAVHTMTYLQRRFGQLGRADKALANHFGGPGSIPSTGCSESELDREIFAPVSDVALNGCELHFNFV